IAEAILHQVFSKLPEVVIVFARSALLERDRLRQVDVALLWTGSIDRPREQRNAQNQATAGFLFDPLAPMFEPPGGPLDIVPRLAADKVFAPDGVAVQPGGKRIEVISAVRPAIGGDCRFGGLRALEGCESEGAQDEGNLPDSGDGCF